MIGVRDPFGFRPLVLGRLPADRTAAAAAEPACGARSGRRRDVGWVLSSETTGLDIVGAEYVRDVEPGEIVVLEPGRAPRSVRYAAGDARPVRLRADLLRPARLVHGGPQPVRGPAADGRCSSPASTPPTPTSSCPCRTPAPRPRPATPRRPGIPYREGLVRNRYTGRTFIQPSPDDAPARRDDEAQPAPRGRPRQAPRRSSTTRSSAGTTTKQIVALLRRAGAAEVHVRISAPPIYHPCFYGIDTQVETELIAATHSVEEIREFIGADSLGYLSIRGVLAALDLPYDRFCFACFDGNYPEPVPYDAARRKFILEEAGRRSVAERRAGRRYAYARSGVDVAAGERAVELMRAARRVDPPAGGPRRARRVRRRDRDPGRLSRAGARLVDRRRRHEDRDRRARSAATTRSASTSSRCAPTTSSAAAPSRCSSSTTSRSAGSTRSRSPSSSAASRPAAARPAARSSAARRPSTRG